jgi:hypothetical protein
MRKQHEKRMHLRKNDLKNIVLAIVIIIGCLTSLIMLNHGAISARTQGKAFALARERFPAYTVKRTVDVYSLWQEHQARGRIVVHLGRFLHFMEESSEGPPQIAAIAADHAHFHIRQISYRDFLWASFQTNIAREIYTVLPPADFKEKIGATPQQNKFVIYEFCSPRIFTMSLPSVAEPVLLNIDASFFASTDTAQLVNDLMKSGLKADIVTICLAEDNPDVTDLDRRKARDFIALLSQHATISEYPASPRYSKDSR